ncbi:hypothetical protein LguiA_000738 [Lonicera macranthoides]
MKCCGLISDKEIRSPRSMLGFEHPLRRLVFEVQYNELTGSVSGISGISSIETITLTNNNFSSIPTNFFNGMISLQDVYLDYNPFSSWSIPDSLRSVSNLRTFSATSANIAGKIPDFFESGSFSGLINLRLAFNFLEGGLPPSFSGSSIQSLWLNGQRSELKLSGPIDVLQNMTELHEVWLHSNSFSGPSPDLSGLKELQNLSLRDNSFTGLIPVSFVNLPLLKIVNLANNLLQGPSTVFKSSVAVDMIDGTNSFCLSNPGKACDPRVNALLAITQSVGNSKAFGEKWKGNGPCADWLGITCSSGNIIIVNFQKMGLTGRLVLSNNNLTGSIPNELTSLPNLREVDVSNNLLYGKIPSFRPNVIVKTAGNVDLGRDKGLIPTPIKPGSPSGEGTNTPKDGNGNNIYAIGKIVLVVVVEVFLIGLLVLCVYKKATSKCSNIKNYPSFSGSDEDALMIIVGGGGGSSGSDSGNTFISIQVLKDVTNNFSQENILGKGGFGTVYKGELRNGTKIAVKKMESAVMDTKGLDEFKSEIAVLTKVRHKNLVTLLGYCFEGNERLIVYEDIPQGPLSRFLFSWKTESLKPLEWTKRLIVALDVIKAVDYLHNLARQTFIHRDLKPSNILIGDDMRAKVADFRLVPRAPEGKDSLCSFGVILMELITERKAIDAHQQEDGVHLVPWFQKMRTTKELFAKAIDPTLDNLNDEETFVSIEKITELAGHCCSRDPNQRPDMAYVVNKLSSQADRWEPSNPDSYEFDKNDPYEAFLQAVEQWKPRNGTNSSDGSFWSSTDQRQTSISAPSFGLSDSSSTYLDASYVIRK